MQRWHLFIREFKILRISSFLQWKGLWRKVPNTQICIEINFFFEYRMILKIVKIFSIGKLRHYLCFVSHDFSSEVFPWVLIFMRFKSQIPLIFHYCIQVLPRLVSLFPLILFTDWKNPPQVIIGFLKNRLVSCSYFLTKFLQNVVHHFDIIDCFFVSQKIIYNNENWTHFVLFNVLGRQGNNFLLHK